jgi:hypothetical protein
MAETGTSIHQHLEQAAGADAPTGMRGRPVTSDYERDIKRYHRKKGRAQALCDAYGHRWPELDPDEDGFPEGYYVEFTDTPGVLDQIEVCGRCGETRTALLEGGFLDRASGRRYRRPADTVKRPDGYYGSRLDAMDELLRRKGGRKALSRLAQALLSAAETAEAEGDFETAGRLRDELADQL